MLESKLEDTIKAIESDKRIAPPCSASFSFTKSPLKITASLKYCTALIAPLQFQRKFITKGELISSYRTILTQVLIAGH
jgi:hypothetical protein